jgi:anti-sigma factor RsiW
MTCVEARPLLAEVAGGELEGERAADVRAHAVECADCATELDELERTIALCRRAGGEPLPEGFALSLHRALAAAPPPRRRSGWLAAVRAAVAARPLAWAGTAAVLAAGIAVAGTLAAVRPRAHVAASAMYKVPESKVALVKIDFVAAEAIDDVAFEITLPDGLRFVSDGAELAERTFRFQGRLHAGSNPIPIAVRGPRAGRYKLIAHAIGASLDVTHEVLLEVTI